MNKFTAKDALLEEVLFSHNRRYRVPRYQRPYAWETPEVADLWEDVSLETEPHFVGSVIFNTEGQDGYFDIIDGQQRLLTITIILAALRNNVRPYDSDLAERIQEQDIALKDRDGNFTFRILPADTLIEYFTKYVQQASGDILSSKPSNDEETRVKQAYGYVDEQIKLELKRHTTNETKRNLVDHIRKRIAGLIVIAINITGEDDAYEIFETTNANRVELSVADLLKNLIFRKLPPDKDKDFAKDVWQDMAKDIEATNTDLKRFLRYYWISKHDFVSIKSLYRAIKKSVTDYKDFLYRLSDSSMWYCALVEGSEQDFKVFGSSATRIANTMRAIRVMRVSQCYAFLLAVCRNHKRLYGVNPLSIFQFIEKFTFQYSSICKLPTNRVEKVFSNAAIHLEEALNQDRGVSVVVSIFRDLENELKHYSPSKAVFVEGFAKLEYGKEEGAYNLVKYVLNKINTDMNATNEHLVNFATVQIEHLLPLSPHVSWKLKKKDIKGYVNKLGNLTLLSDVINGTIQNYTIDKKLPDLKKSQLAITKNVVEKIEAGGCVWGEQEIEARHAALAERAYERVWKL